MPSTNELRLVAWNCNRGLAAKFKSLQALRPSVAVVSECGGTAEGVRLSEDDPESSIWFGADGKNGVGVIAFDRWQVKLACEPDPRIQWALPVRVTGPVEFSLLAVWAMHKRATE